MATVEDACIRTSVAAERTAGRDLYAAYRKWAEENGHRAINNANLADRLEKLGVKHAKPGSQRLWEVRLKGAPPPNPFRRGPTGSPTAHPPDAPPDPRSTNLPN